MSKIETACCFSGYRPEKMPNKGDITSDEIVFIRDFLGLAVWRTLERGYRHFITGMARGFDTWAALEVLKLKYMDREQRYNDIVLECAIPYEEQSLGWSNYDESIYNFIKSHADKVTNTGGIEKKNGDYKTRNYYMVDSSARLITYYSGKPGGTKQTVEYAKKKELDIINLYDFDKVGICDMYPNL